MATLVSLISRSRRVGFFLASVLLVFGLLVALALASSGYALADEEEVTGAHDHHQMAAQTDDIPANVDASLALGHLFQANLSGAQEVSSADSRATGRAVLALSDDMSTLHYRVRVSDIASITAAHIHFAAQGSNGGVVFWLYDVAGVNGPGGVFDPDNPISGSLTLNPAQVNELMAGNYYVNVHTTQFGGGEMRGQIGHFALPTNFNALLMPQNELHEVTSNALGVARFSAVTTDTLAINLHVTDIVSITMAHIHRGRASENGPVVHWLYDANGVNAPGGPLDADNSIAISVTLDAPDMVDLLTGYYYVNVHTVNYAGGEMRGQIGGVNLFGATLTGAQEVPRTHTHASGNAILGLDAGAANLYGRVLVEDITDITMSHIHRGSVGTNGPVVHWLYHSTGVNAPGGPFGSGEPISATIALSNADLFDLLRGNYYINVHTTKWPGGEIRGQIGMYTPPTYFNAMLTGSQEVPAVATDAVGVTRLTLDNQLDVLHYNITVRDLISPTMAHIHRGWQGSNGPVVHWLYHSTGVNAPGGPLDNTHGAGNGLLLNAQNQVDLLTGYYYVNVHTQDRPGGEIRGQIGGVRVFEAALDGAQEVGPVDTSASGQATFGLNRETTSLHYRLQVREIVTITMAHIHRAPAGVNGPVVHFLYDPSGNQAPGGLFDPANPVAGSRQVSTADLLDLLAGNFYVNVHTQNHPGGEIRGQIHPGWVPLHHLAYLSGANEVPPVATDAQGESLLTWYSGLDALNYTVVVTEIVDITMAHIHWEQAGKNGPPIYWLYHSTGVNAPGGPFDGDNPIGGRLWPNAEQVVDLLTGYYYVNVHTGSNPGGEIRGQVYAKQSLYLPVITRIEQGNGHGDHR